MTIANTNSIVVAEATMYSLFNVSLIVVTLVAIVASILGSRQLRQEDERYERDRERRYYPEYNDRFPNRYRVP